MKASTKSRRLSATGEVENETYWKKHIELLKASDLTRKEYCSVNQVHYDRFAYWLHKGFSQPQSLVAVKFREEQAFDDQPKLLGTLVLNQGRKLLIHDHSILGWILERV
jgi:hypothetical protein